MNEEAIRQIKACIEAHRQEALGAKEVVARLGRLQRSAKSGQPFSQADIVALSQANDALNRAEVDANTQIIALANSLFE